MKRVIVILAVLLCLSFVFTGVCFAETLNFEGWLYEENEDGTITITGYEGDETAPILPATINNKTVTEIAPNAFKGNKTITSIVLPTGLEKIGDNAFEGCEQLKTISIPATVKEIGADVFVGCTEVTVNCAPGSYIEEFFKDNPVENVTVEVAVVQNVPVVETKVEVPDGIPFKANNESYIVRIGEDNKVKNVYRLTDNQYVDVLPELDVQDNSAFPNEDCMVSSLTYTSLNPDYEDNDVLNTVILRISPTDGLKRVVYVERLNELYEPVAIDTIVYAGADGSIVEEYHLDKVTNDSTTEQRVSVTVNEEFDYKLVQANVKTNDPNLTSYDNLAAEANNYVTTIDGYDDPFYGECGSYHWNANEAGFGFLGYDWDMLYSSAAKLVSYRITEYVLEAPADPSGAEVWKSTAYELTTPDFNEGSIFDNDAILYDDESGEVTGIDTTSVNASKVEKTYDLSQPNPLADPDVSEPSSLGDEDVTKVIELYNESQDEFNEVLFGDNSPYKEAKDAVNSAINPGVDEVEGYLEPICDPVVPAAIASETPSPEA